MTTCAILVVSWWISVFPTADTRQSADEYVEAGDAKFKKGDFDGAMADYAKAIEVDPRYAKAYLRRGILKSRRNDRAGALADFGRAVELDPGNADAYVERGWARLMESDVEGASTDFDKAIEIDPHHAMAYDRRAQFRSKFLGDDSGAMADRARAIELDHGIAREEKEIGLYDAQDWRGALEGWRKRHAGSAHLLPRLWLARARLGEREEATKEISGILSKLKPSGSDTWYLMPARFLSGEVSETEFLKAAESPDPVLAKRRRCVAYFYAGTKRLIDGDERTAASHLRTCLDTGHTDCCEYRSAVVELERLDKFQETDYEPCERFQVGEIQVQGYESRKETRTRFYFAIRTEPPRLYRIDVKPIQTDRIRMIAYFPEKEIVRVAAVTVARADYAAARGLVESAEKAAPDWERHRTFFDSSDPEVVRQAWTRAALDLERARDRHPSHVGILRDLIVAYTQLLAFERDSPRGTNLCSFIPRSIADYESAVGTLTGEESRTFRRCRALLYCRIGLYPLARTQVELDPGDPELQAVGKMLETIGQSGFSKLETFEIGPYRVTAYETKESPPEDKSLSARWYFVLELKDAVAEPVWYTLSRQILTDAPRYYLYGCAANQRKVLQLFGRRAPSYDETKAKIRECVEEALRKPK